jgi:hypothetical protein
MKVLPILYNTDMVLAKLDGRKTVTRRPMKIQPDDSGLHDHTQFPMSVVSDLKGWHGTRADNGESIEFKAPYKPGHIIYVRETVYEHGEWAWQSFPSGDGEEVFRSHYPRIFSYKAGGGKPDKFRTLPSIHMPKEAARIWERVVSVRAERLGDITEEDAIKEGARYFKDLPIGPITPVTSDPNRWSMGNPLNTDSCLSSARWAFASLWDKVYGTWYHNPWVWRIQTEILSTTGRPKDI